MLVNGVPAYAEDWSYSAGGLTITSLGLDPTHKGARLANYIVTLRKELTRLSHACGCLHPALLTAEHMEILDGNFGSRPLSEVFGYEPRWELCSQPDLAKVERLMGS